MDKLQAKMQTFSQNSEPTAVEDKDYLCSKCKDQGGFIVRRKAGETTVSMFQGQQIEKTLAYDMDDWQDCECIKIRRVNNLIKSSTITEEFQKMGFKNFHVEDRPEAIKRMKELAKLYYRNFHTVRNERVNSVVFIGQPGCGKTHLLTAIANCLMYEHQIPVLYFPFKDGMNSISENDFENKHKIIQRMKDVDVLFIDDLFKPIGGRLEFDKEGKPKIIKFQAEVIYEVFNYRYLNKLPMLVSTELTLEELLLIDEATMSRVFEMAADYTVTVDKDMSNNYRLRKVMGL